METTKRAVALGIFDGVHLGHRAVLKMTESGGVPAVFTFENRSLRSKQGRTIEYIYTDPQKADIISSLGISEVYSEDFSAVRDMSGEEFVSEILVKRLNASSAACGRDFRFGRGALCGVNELAELGKKYGFAVNVSDDVMLDGETVSSNRIRQLLGEGNAAGAAALLGDDYIISGTVVHGKQLGRTIAFPTVNQIFEAEQLVPRYGVYASSVTIGGRKYSAVTNIGVKPTVEGERAPLAETHIIGFDGDLYGERLAVALKGFIRAEKRFASLEELGEQIGKDVASCLSHDMHR